MLRRGLFFFCFILGGILLARGLWLQAKPCVADILLTQSWEDSVRSGQAARPWPGMDAVPLARLRIADLGISQIVLDRASGQALAFAPAYMRDSVRPGGSGVSAIAAHKNTHFAFLEHMKPGTEIRLQTVDGQEHVYRAGQGRIVDMSKETISLNTDASGLLLITCYPFDALSFGGSLRYVVPAVKQPNPNGSTHVSNTVPSNSPSL